MERLSIPVRSDWKQQADNFGFLFHTIDGDLYWDESVAWRFSLAEIENDLEDPTVELHQMCLEAMADIVESEYWMERFAIPQFAWNLVRDSWHRQAFSLYGRMDFSYHGKGSGPAKLLEYNADTPTSLYEAGFFQWLWLEQQVARGVLPPDADQFNLIQELLVRQFERLSDNFSGPCLHMCCSPDSDEDRGTVQYLQDCASQAGLENKFLFIDDIGQTKEGRFTDLQDQLIHACFKLYPWEFMLREEGAADLAKADVLWLEPVWKSVLSNKAILVYLWEKYPEHPNLLPAYFDDYPATSLRGTWLRKPIFSREGANIDWLCDGTCTESSDGPYGVEGSIVQLAHPLPCVDGHHMLVGSWVVGNEACGLSIREDHSRITQDTSRFVPHFIAE